MAWLSPNTGLLDSFSLRFFERIAKSYRKDGWNTILREILLLSFACAKNLGKTDSAITYAAELLSDGEHRTLGTTQLPCAFNIFLIPSRSRAGTGTPQGDSR